MNFTTESVNKLSVPFGSIIGPCTVISNIAKLVNDIVKIAYFSFVNRNYEPSDKYYQFKLADLKWEQQVSPHYKPIVSDDGYVNVEPSFLEDPQQAIVVGSALGSSPCVDWVLAYKDLSQDDKREIELENHKKELYRHVAFIAVGMIRSIPVIGGAMLYYYEVGKVEAKPFVNSTTSDADAASHNDGPFFPLEIDDEINS